MELNKKKYREYLVNLLNLVFDTNSFSANNNKKNMHLYQIKSDNLSCAVNINFDIIDFDSKNYLKNITEIIKKIDKDNNFEHLIFITYSDFGDELYEFYSFVDKNFNLEVDIWDKDSLNSRFNSYLIEEDEDTFDPQDFPYALNSFPEISNSDLFFPKQTFNEIDNVFFNKKSQICVLFSDMISSGKTNAVTKYAFSRKNKFNHIAYVKIHNDLKIDFINSFTNDSKLEFTYNNNFNLYKNYFDLLTLLNLFDQQANLLIIEDVLTISEIAIIQEIAKATKFKILISSIARLQNFYNVKLKHPENKQLLNILNKNIPQADYQIIEDVFKPIDNNLLFADFLGKQVKSNKKLKLDKLVKNIKAKEKKVYRLGKYILPGLDRQTVSKHQLLLKDIMAVYEMQVKDFTKAQKQILKLISVLPQIKITFKDLMFFLNVKDDETDDFVNELINLQKKAWIETSKKNIFISDSVKKILHKKLKPNATSLSETLKKINQTLNEKPVIRNVIIAESVIHNLNSASEITVDILEKLSNFYSEIGYLDKIEYYADIAAKIFEKILEFKEPDFDDLKRLIMLYRSSKDFEKALYYSQNIHTLTIMKYGEDSLQAAETAIYMAINLKDLHDYYNAISYIDDALDILEQFYEPQEEPLELAIEIHEQLSDLIENEEEKNNYNKFMQNFFKDNS